MIISSTHKFVFAAIPKTGTHSVRRGLREHLGPDDQEQVGLFEEKVLSIAALAELKHGHLALRQLRPHMAPAAFEDYFKFAFVRNPFDRFVSFCSFAARKTGAFEQQPKAVMQSHLFPRPTLHMLMAPQYMFVMDGAGKLLADYLGRFETMQESYDEICSRIGIPAAPLQRTNESEHGDYRSYYDSQLVDAVAKVYARDLELFGYEF